MFTQIERRLCDWFDANGFETLIEGGEWVIIRIEGKPISITSMAKAVADDLALART